MFHLRTLFAPKFKWQQEKQNDENFSIKITFQFLKNFLKYVLLSMSQLFFYFLHFGVKCHCHSFSLNVLNKKIALDHWRGITLFECFMSKFYFQFKFCFTMREYSKNKYNVKTIKIKTKITTLATRWMKDTAIHIQRKTSHNLWNWSREKSKKKNELLIKFLREFNKITFQNIHIVKKKNWNLKRKMQKMLKFLQEQGKNKIVEDKTIAKEDVKTEKKRLRNL